MLDKILIVMRCAERMTQTFSDLEKYGISCCTSRFSSPACSLQTSTTFDHFFEGGKWAGIFDFFRHNPDTLSQFDYFWFPDDDIVSSTQNALDFLKIVVSENFELAQPALTPNSFYAYRPTLQNPQFIFRHTNFVELMLPIMKKEILTKVLPLFEQRHAALGVDQFWHLLSTDPANKIAIVDQTPMYHSRPRGTFLKENMTRQSRSISDEKQQTVALLNIVPTPPVTMSGRLKGKHETAGRISTGFGLVRGLYHIKQDVKDRAITNFDIFSDFMKCVIFHKSASVDLSRIANLQSEFAMRFPQLSP